MNKGSHYMSQNNKNLKENKSNMKGNTTMKNKTNNERTTGGI